MGNRSGRPNLQAYDTSVNPESSSADDGGNNAIAFPGSNLQTYDMSVSPDSSSADDSGGNPIGRGVYTALPSHIWSLNGELLETRNKKVIFCTQVDTYH